MLGFIKRFVPFVVAVTLGLFVASFFVTVSAPNFNLKRERIKKHREYDRQRESEIQRLREENARLKEELREEKLKNMSFSDYDWENRNSGISQLQKNSEVVPQAEDKYARTK